MFCISFLVQTFRRGLAVRAREGGLRRWMAVIWVSGMAGVALGQVANIVATGESKPGPYVAGILVLLAISGLQFILLALASISEEP